MSLEDCLDMILFHTYDKTLNVKDVSILSEVSKTCKSTVNAHLTYCKKKVLSASKKEHTIPLRYAKCNSCCKCKQYTSFRYDISDTKPNMCKSCIKSVTISDKEAVKKWNLPLEILQKLPSLLLQDVRVFDKEHARKLAIEYHIGTSNLFLACEGKAKAKRQKDVIKMCLKFSGKDRDQFENTCFVSQYMKNGKGGVKALKNAATNWESFITQRNSLQPSLVPHFRLSWFDEDQNVNVEAKAEQCIMEKKRSELLCNLKYSSYKLWTSEEEAEFVTKGNIDIITQIRKREERLADIPNYLRKYMFIYIPQYLYSEEMPENLIDVLKTFSFLVNKTPYHYYYNRYLKTNNTEKASKLAQRKAISTYLDLGMALPNYFVSNE